MKPIREIWTHAATDPRWVIALAVVLFGWNLSGYDLWAPNEPFFGEGAREMLADGKWLVSHINGELNTHKPPLFFWLIAGFSAPAGAVSSLTARLPSVLAALGSLFLTLRLGRRTSGARTAVLAGAILLTTHMFWDKARSAQIDALMSFLILIAVSAFEAWRAGDWGGRQAGIVFWLAAALATLSKGPVGMAVPLGIVLVTLAFDRKLHRWREFAPLSGPLVFVAVTGLWALAASLWGGYSLGGALQEHVVDRAIHGMHHAQPFWYYLKVLPAVMIPWSFLLPVALVYAWRRRHRADDRLLLIAGVFVVVFFSIPTEKRDLYILPAAPFFALLIARLVAAVAGWRERSGETDSRVANDDAPSQRWVTVPQGIMAAVLLLAAIAAPIIAPRFGQEMVAPAYGLAAALGLGAGGTLVAAFRGQALRSVVGSGATLAAGMLVAVSFVYPLLNPSKSSRELATVMRAETAAARAAGRPVVALGLINVLHAVNFYSDGVYMREIDTLEEDVIADLANGSVTYLLADEALLGPLPEALVAKMTIVYETRLSRMNLKLLRFD